MSGLKGYQKPQASWKEQFNPFMNMETITTHDLAYMALITYTRIKCQAMADSVWVENQGGIEDVALLDNKNRNNKWQESL